MKWIKKISLYFGVAALILFLIFGVEYNCGYKYPKTDKCVFPKGQKKVYVHWIKFLNTKYGTFCDYSRTPLYYKNAKDHFCNCDNH